MGGGGGWILIISSYFFLLNTQFERHIVPLSCWKVCGGGWAVCEPISVLSLEQAEQNLNIRLELLCKIDWIMLQSLWYLFDYF